MRGGGEVIDELICLGWWGGVGGVGGRVSEEGRVGSAAKDVEEPVVKGKGWIQWWRHCIQWQGIGLEETDGVEMVGV